MTEHKHCDHLTSQQIGTAGTRRNYICCHCGRVREEVTPPYDPRKWEYKQDDHGPFAQDIQRW